MNLEFDSLFQYCIEGNLSNGVTWFNGYDRYEKEQAEKDDCTRIRNGRKWNWEMQKRLLSQDLSVYQQMCEAFELILGRN